MILHCNFEELQALSAGAEMVLSVTTASGDSAIATPPEAVAAVETLAPHFTGDLSVSTLAEQRRLRDAVSLICDGLHTRMDEVIVEYHPAHEEAVSLYFDYAHVRTVLERVEQIGSEMDAIIELITGAPPTDESAASVTFPD